MVNGLGGLVISQAIMAIIGIADIELPIISFVDSGRSNKSCIGFVNLKDCSGLNSSA